MTDVLVYGLSGMFLIGVFGCLFVVPITAFRLFAILFEQKPDDEE